MSRESDSEGLATRAARILIVEDDRAALDGLVALVREAGYSVTGVATFEEARRALADEPDLLVTDIRLGAFNGLQLIIRGRALNPLLRAIVMTGYPDIVVRREAERLGALHLEKPINAARILGAVAEAIARPQSPPDR